MAILLPQGKQQYFTAAGVPLVGGRLWTLDAGTVPFSFPRATYQDAAGTVPNANPIILDARGEATIYWAGSYKVVLQDALGATIWTQDNVTSISGSNSVLDNYSADTGAANAYVVAAATPMTAYVAGLRVVVKVNNTNTGASTLNYMGLGVRNITMDGHALYGGELQVGGVYAFEYDGAVFQLLNGTDPARARTAVEIAASITPSNYSYFPYDVLRYGIVADGVTSQTAALVALLTSFGANNNLRLTIPANVVFAPATVFAAVPTGVRLVINDTTNWGQPPGYRNKFAIEYTGDTVSNDSQSIIASGHHPAQMLLNMGTAGSTAAANRYGSQLHGVGRDADGDPILGWLMQYAKDPSLARWRTSWRLQTPYSVAIANPQPWVTATVYAAGAYCTSDGGKVYTTVAGGTSGGAAPTGTGAGINDGGALWNYVQAALNIDATRFDLDENGNIGSYAAAGSASRYSQSAGARSHYIEIDDASDDIIWRDVSRGLDVLRVSTANGLQVGTCQSFPFQSMSGATPTLVGSYAYVNNGGAVTMTNMALPGSQTAGYALLLFANGNTTLQNGANFVLRGGVNVTPASGQMIELVKYPTHSGAWIEKSRSF